MPEEKDFGSIYEPVLAHCLPYSHEEPWHDFLVPDDIRRLPASPDAMIADLREEFSDAQLQEAGVIAMDENVVIQPNPLLCEEGGLVIAMRKTPEAKPFELQVNERILSGRTLPVCAAMQDGGVCGDDCGDQNADVVRGHYGGRFGHTLVAEYPCDRGYRIGRA